MMVGMEEGLGGGETTGNYGWNVMYERRIRKKYPSLNFFLVAISNLAHRLLILLLNKSLITIGLSL